MKRIFLCLSFTVAALFAAGKDAKPKPTVPLARSWSDAVKEAKLLNVPIVLHHHGFYWGPCHSLHRSVLQNKGYIKFAGKSCVDVIALSDWEQALKEGHRTQTFKAPDEYGDQVKWLLLYPTLQPGDLDTLYNPTTVSFNKTGIMPYTAIVDPHTEKELIGIPRGQTSLQRLKDAVVTAKKKLNEQHGPSVSRKTVAAVRKQQDQIQDKLYDGNVSGAMAQFRQLKKSVAKQPPSVRELAADTWMILVKTAEKRLAEAERLLEGGKRDEAFSLLKPLARAFKDTELQDRIETLVQKAQGG